MNSFHLEPREYLLCYLVVHADLPAAGGCCYALHVHLNLAPFPLLSLQRIICNINKKIPSSLFPLEAFQAR